MLLRFRPGAVDRLGDELLSDHVLVQSVQSQFHRQQGMGGECRRHIDVHLGAQEGVDEGELRLPVIRCRLVKGACDVLGVDRRQREEDGADAVCEAACLEFFKVGDDLGGTDARTQAVRAVQDEQVARMEGQDVRLEAFEHCLARIAAHREVDGGKDRRAS